jgi:peptidoglycan/LPS O-acetylase OafA/YrhL
MNSIAKPRYYRNTGIDILRGLSILFVVLLHLNIHFSLGDSFVKEWLPSKLYSLLFWSGYNGVVVFFTLSGYLITLSAISKWGAVHKLNAKQFYLLRAARILPLLCALLILLSSLHLLGVPAFVINPDKASLVKVLLATLTFQMNWLQIQVGYLPANWDVLWSISIEESFYFFFPLLCLLVRSEKQFVGFLLVFFVISPWARVGLFPGNELGDRNHLAYVDAIAMGCIVALACVHSNLKKVVSWIALVVGGNLLIFSFAYKGTIYRLGLTTNGLNISLLILGTGLTLIWLHNNVRSKKQCLKLSWTYAWLVNWGRYSYEIYLTHMFIVIGASAVHKELSSVPDLLIPFLLCACLASYWFGKVIFHWFSEPLNQKIRNHFLPRKGV